MYQTPGERALGEVDQSRVSLKRDIKLADEL
jgi:hypothetical protein